MLSASVTVMDPIALTMIQKYGGEFGRERLFSTLGMAVFSPLTGYLIDFKSRKIGKKVIFTVSHLISIEKVIKKYVFVNGYLTKLSVSLCV